MYNVTYQMKDLPKLYKKFKLLFNKILSIRKFIDKKCMFIINAINVANGSTLTIIIQFFRTNIFFKIASQIKKILQTKLDEL